MGALECKKCGRWVDNVGEDTKTVICSYCVIGMVGLPEEKKSYTPTGRPPGWHFMSEFVDKDGNVFHKGKEQPKLKGTLKPTKVKPRKKKKKLTPDEKLQRDIKRWNKRKKARRGKK